MHTMDIMKPLWQQIEQHKSHQQKMQILVFNKMHGWWDYFLQTLHILGLTNT